MQFVKTKREKWFFKLHSTILLWHASFDLTRYSVTIIKLPNYPVWWQDGDNGGGKHPTNIHFNIKEIFIISPKHLYFFCKKDILLGKEAIFHVQLLEK